MLKNNLRFIMAERRIENLSTLMEMTGLSRNVLKKLWHDEDVETVKLESLMKVCDTLDIPLSTLVEYKPLEK